jgi:hypothetical protein
MSVHDKQKETARERLERLVALPAAVNLVQSCAKPLTFKASENPPSRVRTGQTTPDPSLPEPIAAGLF